MKETHIKREETTAKHRRRSKQTGNKKSQKEWKYRAPKPACGTTLRCWPTEGYKLGGNLKSWVRWKITSVDNKPGWTGHGDAFRNI